MRALYVPAGLLALILGFSLWAGRYVEMRTEQWNAALELADQSAAQENWTEAARRLEQAYKDWDSSQTFFHTIMDHNELDEAEKLFAGAFAVCREGTTRTSTRCWPSSPASSAYWRRPRA